MNSRIGLVVASCLCAAACAHETPRRPLPPPPTSPLREESVPATERPRVEIVDLQDAPTPDRKHVTLNGTLINRGSGPTRRVSVHIEGFDANDAVVLSADATPSTEAIAPSATANFTTTVDNNPAVIRYRVEVIAR